MTKLQLLIAKKGFSLRKFAKEAGVDLSSLSRISNNLQKAQLLTLTKIAGVLDIEVEELSEYLDIDYSERGKQAASKRKKGSVNAEKP